MASAISIKSADSWKEKSKNLKNFLLFLLQQFSSKTVTRIDAFFASNEQVAPNYEKAIGIVAAEKTPQ